MIPTPPRPSGPPADPRPDPDVGAALEAMGGDAELFAEVAQVLADEAPRQLSRLEAALAAGDLATAFREAHTLKGSLGSFAALTAQAAAAALEAAARDGRRDDCRALYDRLAAATGAALAALRPYSAPAAVSASAARSVPANPS